MHLHHDGLKARDVQNGGMLQKANSGGREDSQDKVKEPANLNESAVHLLFLSVAD